MKNRFIPFIFITTLLLTGCAEKGLTEDTSSDIRKLQTTHSLEETTYISETICTNDSLPPELFDLSFQTTENAQYVNNKELAEYIGGEENIIPYLNTAKAACELTFAQNGYAIKEEEYKKALSNLYKSTEGIQIGENVYSAEEYALYMYGLYVDNKISVKSDFLTDKSLFWQNNYVYHVRGVLTLTLEEDANGAYKKEFGIPLDNSSDSISLIVQVRFMPDNPNEILGIDILGEIEP